MNTTTPSRGSGKRCDRRADVKAPKSKHQASSFAKATARQAREVFQTSNCKPQCQVWCLKLFGAWMLALAATTPAGFGGLPPQALPHGQTGAGTARHISRSAAPRRGSRNHAVEFPGSTAAPAVVRRALAPNARAFGNTKWWVNSTPPSGTRGRVPLRPRRARSPTQLHGYG